ncbi:quinone oxidoreductase family protein [Neobacillus vireti]|uniref:Zinc-binding alcohol dehydrogenase n=1 Tax=Neobacillus vireti LMG 21834 TaxID=1131730 RepID=A0AB94IPE3_9BACI|nr:zinc-binding dehydrogenase [Neobacillus vireti]ETI68833.1 zinc-binding alcohol dehydrogenase [Neobacillus vireti LMG 21834]KLT19615.1 alcohol dehydrogenase [Neobacillus vireti]
MKAIILKEKGGPEKLRYEEVESPAPKAGEVLVKLKYAALNRRDVFITYGKYPGVKLPSILGSDGAGVIAAIGENVDNFKIGSEVVINPGLSWGEDDRISNSDFNVLGMPTDGTYAEYVVAPSENIFPKPEYLTWEEAAALPLAGLTAYRALISKGEVQKGETVVIPGIGGGVALYLLQMAVAKGANVFVTSSSDEKIERAKQLGALGGFNYRSENWVKQMRKTIGAADLIVDGVGGSGFNDLIYLAAQGGRIVTFGATNGPVSEFILPRIFFKDMDIRGTALGSPREFTQMLKFVNEHRLHPVIDRSFSLEQTVEAQLYMNNGNNFGKITLEID